MRVFLSSTGRDLQKHREAAFRAIQGLGMHCVRMEDFHGAAAKVEDFDDRRIAECDLFVLILGLLHGSSPDGNESSYTELEYATAQKLGKPCFIFVAPEDFALPGSLRETDAKWARQRAFRESAVKGVIRDSFTSPDDLGTRIVQAIRDWEQSGENRNAGRKALLLPLPPLPYLAHPYPLQENFTGRVRERRLLTDWLTGDRNVLSVAAIGGMGKSALTWAWVQCDVLGFPLPGVAQRSESRVPESARPEGVLWWSFYEREAGFTAFVRESLLYASGGAAEAASVYDGVRALTSLVSQRRLLLVLDGFERELRAYGGGNAAYQGDEYHSDDDVRGCIDPNAGTLLRWLASTPMRTRILITTRMHPRELDGLAGCRRQDLSALEPEDAAHFFQAQGVRGTRAEIEAACAPYGYHPLALRLLAGVVMKDRKTPGDIRTAARHPVLPELRGKAKHHILQVAYDAMEPPGRELLSQLAAFRNPVSRDAVSALNPFESEPQLERALADLMDRGLLSFDAMQSRFDLHPVVRQYAYERLGNKTVVHGKLRDYFATEAKPRHGDIKSVDELAPVTELYHHTVRAGQYDAANELFKDRLHDDLYYTLGAYTACIELLRALFPDGEDRPPRLESEAAQSWAQVALANSYSRHGEVRRAIGLFTMAAAIYERAGYDEYIATGSTNLGRSQLSVGLLSETDNNLRRALECARNVKSEYKQAGALCELARLAAYEGRRIARSQEFEGAVELLAELGDEQVECVWQAHRALGALLAKQGEEAVELARRSRELAAVRRNARDMVRSEWISGWAVMDKIPAEAAEHLSTAITSCRRINLIELEPDILLAWARWHRAAGNQQAARENAEEALAIADRCEYRLVQADAHNILGQLALDRGDPAAARQHAEIGRERAWCDGPPHCYRPALDQADSLLARLR